MSGWRDADGRTAADRRRQSKAEDAARFRDTVRHRPASLLKPIAGFLFILLLVLALMFRWI